MGPNPLSSAIFDPPIQLVYPLNTCHYLPILLVLIHASVLITMFYPIVYPFCSFFSIFFRDCCTNVFGIVECTPHSFHIFLSHPMADTAHSNKEKTCSRRSCEPPPSAWRRASVETPQVRRAGRKWRALEKSFVWVNGDIIRDIYIYIYNNYLFLFMFICLYAGYMCIYIYMCVCAYTFM